MWDEWVSRADKVRKGEVSEIPPACCLNNLTQLGPPAISFFFQKIGPRSGYGVYLVHKFTPGYIIMPPKLRGHVLYLEGGFYFGVLNVFENFFNRPAIFFEFYWVLISVKF